MCMCVCTWWGAMSCCCRGNSEGRGRRDGAPRVLSWLNLKQGGGERSHIILQENYLKQIQKAENGLWLHLCVGLHSGDNDVSGITRFCWEGATMTPPDCGTYRWGRKRRTYLRAACTGGVSAWTGSDRGRHLPPRCSEPPRGESSPVTPTPARLKKNQKKNTGGEKRNVFPGVGDPVSLLQQIPSLFSKKSPKNQKPPEWRNTVLKSV